MRALKQLAICVTALACIFSASKGFTDEATLLFGGQGNYIDVGTPDALQIPSNNPFTIEGWMLFNSTDMRDMLYSKNNGRSAAPYSYMLGFDYDNLVALSSAAGGFVGHFPVTRETNHWYHIAFIFDGTDMAFYMDGALIGTAGFEFDNYPEHTIKLGGYHSAYGDIDGSYSDVRVWNYARSQAEIQASMSNRLSGVESGLIGYWPINEGTGTIVQDCTGNGSHGNIIGATWTTDAALADIFDSDVVTIPPFFMADIETGSTKFTNSNTVDVAGFAVPQGCDRYQINQSAEPDEIDPGAWTGTNNLPDSLTFALPAGNSNILFYAWFTNAVDAIKAHRSAARICYTTSAPAPIVRSPYTRSMISGQPVVIYPEELDNGTSGGEAEGETIPIHSLSLNLLSGPDTNATPNEPFITVSELGNYEIEMVAVNAAGNIATSSVSEVEIVAYTGDPFTWTGEAGENWFTPLNWDQKAIPIDNADVIINTGADILLTNSTAALASLSMSGGTLRMTNWTTCIQATEISLTGGTIRPEAAFDDTSMSNRIWIICSNLTVGASAVINADALGYAGVLSGDGNGPGGALASGNRGSGGGYGGRGGQGSTSAITAPGWPYGDPAYPLMPGSSGSWGSAGSAGDPSGSGGGAVFIDASGQVTLEGTISANGERAKNYKGSGSGGGILIQCRTIQGSGVLSADGGDRSPIGSGGDGGGGRIAVHYDSAAQALLPVPALTISVKAGLYAVLASVSEFGSIYLTDTRLLTETVTNIRGWLYIPGFTSWSPTSLTLTDSYLGIMAEGFTLSVDGDISGSGNRLIGLQTNATVTVGGNLDCGLDLNTGSVLTVTGNLRIPPADLPNYQSRTKATDVSIAGNLDMEYIWHFTSALTNESDDYGSLIDIGKDLTIASNGVLYLASHFTNGGSAFIRAENVFIAEGGTINADERGFGGVGLVSYGPGAGGPGGSRGGGGGYGGRGGHGYSSGVGGITNGMAYAPFMPGSAGGYGNGLSGGLGGGLVRIDADTVIVDGTITANGQRGGYMGSGSGGGIFIRTRTFSGGSNAVMRANGGNYGSISGGTGGGGRIAVWQWTIDDGVSEKIFSGYAEDLGDRITVTTGLDSYAGIAEALKGENDPFAGTEDGAENGTVFFLTILPPNVTLMIAY